MRARVGILAVVLVCACVSDGPPGEPDAGPAPSLDCGALVGRADTAPWSRELALCAAVVGSSCVSGQRYDQPVGAETFFDDMVAMSPEQVRCLAGAGSDCVAASACVGRSLDLEATCERSSAERRCEGDDLVTCTEQGTLRRHCPTDHESAGPTCIDGGGGPECGGAGACVEGEARCEGDFLLRCADDAAGLVWSGEDCARSGWTCVEDGGAHCADGREVPCADSGAPVCHHGEDGDFLIDCRDGFERRLDCSRLEGAFCVEGGYQCRLGDECGREPDEAQMEECDATDLTFCAGGVRASLDCRDLGFPSCDQDFFIDDGGTLWIGGGFCRAPVREPSGVTVSVTS
jgi:hypothetical protein